MAKKLEILWSDENYVAISKPAGLAVIPGRGEDTSALEELAGQLGLPCKGQDDPRLRIVHRIDKDTSGVVLMAKNKSAQRWVSEQFQNNLVAKEYVALVAATPAQDSGQVDSPLARHPTNPLRLAVDKRGRPARTLWTLEKRFGGLSLLRVFPKTGKTHQIRVHLASIGLPLAIDPLYHPGRPVAEPGIFLSAFKRGYRPAADRQERPLISRLTLHAHKLTFTNLDGKAVTITADYPKDLAAAINMLGKYARGSG